MDKIKRNSSTKARPIKVFAKTVFITLASIGIAVLGYFAAAYISALF